MSLFAVLAALLSVTCRDAETLLSETWGSGGGGDVGGEIKKWSDRETGSDTGG